MRITKYFVLLVSLACWEPVIADHQFDIDQWYLSFGTSRGGDDVAKLDILVDEPGSSEVLESRSLSAGDGFQFTLGSAIRVAQTPFSVRATAGWHSDKLTATTGKAQFTRIPVELLSFYAYHNHKFGIGITAHLNTELDIEDAAGPIVKFKPSTGLVLEYGYALGGLGYLSSYWLGLKFVSIDYEVDQVDGNPYDGAALRFDGSHISAFIGVGW